MDRVSRKKKKIIRKKLVDFISADLHRGNTEATQKQKKSLEKQINKAFDQWTLHQLSSVAAQKIKRLHNENLFDRFLKEGRV